MLSTIDFLAASVCLYYGNKLYNSTRGAADFWLFLSAFIASLGAYTLFDFTRKVLFVHYDIPLIFSTGPYFGVRSYICAHICNIREEDV